MTAGAPNGHTPELAQCFADERGRLTLLPFGELPFAPTRAYVLDQIPPGASRGGHANRTQHRLLLIIRGRTAVTLDNGARIEELVLSAGETLLVPPGLWHELHALGGDLAVMVLADGSYDRGDHVTEREELPIGDARPPAGATEAAMRSS